MYNVQDVIKINDFYRDTGNPLAREFYQAYTEQKILADMEKSATGVIPDSLSCSIRFAESHMGRLNEITNLVSTMSSTYDESLPYFKAVSDQWANEIFDGLYQKLAGNARLASSLGNKRAQYFYDNPVTFNLMLVYDLKFTGFVLDVIKDGFLAYANIVEPHPMGIVFSKVDDNVLSPCLRITRGDWTNYYLYYNILTDNGISVVVDLVSADRSREDLNDETITYRSVEHYEFAINDVRTAIPEFMIDLIRDEVRQTKEYKYYA